MVTNHASSDETRTPAVKNMIIEGNKVFLYSDECQLQPTAENAFIVYDFSQFQDLYTECLFTHRENYRKIKRIFQAGYSNIEISIRDVQS